MLKSLAHYMNGEGSQFSQIRTSSEKVRNMLKMW